MTNKMIFTGVLAALLPATAMAQPAPGCVRSNQQSRAEGTVLGAGAGALIGSQLAGRGSRGEGAVLGAVGGAVAGNAIAGARNTPCPPGYYYVRRRGRSAMGRDRATGRGRPWASGAEPPSTSARG